MCFDRYHDIISTSDALTDAGLCYKEGVYPEYSESYHNPMAIML